MTLQIEHCKDVSVIAPILKVLRNTLADGVFDSRLERGLQEGYRVLIAKDSNAVEGCLGYRIVYDVYWGKTLYVDDLVVRPEARGKGTGAALLKDAKTEAAEHRCDHVRLCSGLSRADAHRFYEKNGFARTSLQFFYALEDGEN